jgi:hypothetical protein
MSGIETLGGNMLAYDYLKENPRENAKLISDGWATLVTDPTVPYGVKRELLDLQKITPDITDSLLYFHGVYTIDCMVDKSTDKSKRLFNELPTLRPWLDAAYSYLQNNIGTKERVDSFFRFLGRNLLTIPTCLTMQEMIAVVNTYTKMVGNTNLTLADLCLDAIRHDNARRLLSNRYVTITHAYEFFRFLDRSFLVKADEETLKKAIDLFRDVPIPDDDQPKYKSLSEMERAHDERTAQEVKRMLEDKPRRYTYHAEFMELVTKYGFTLPMTKNDMVFRGAEHHNCVATYANKHFTMYEYSHYYTRLIFAKDATAELSLYHSHGKIVAVMVPQYKGRYNKDFAEPEELTNLRIELTGKPVNILNIMEVGRETVN